MKTYELIREARRNKQLTQDALATKLGKTKNYVSLIEGGKKNPSLKTLRKLSQILDVPYLLLIKDKLGLPKASCQQEEVILTEIQGLLTKLEEFHERNQTSGTL